MRCYSNKATDLYITIVGKGKSSRTLRKFLLRISGSINCQHDFRRRVTSLDWSELATSVEDNVRLSRVEWPVQSHQTPRTMCWRHRCRKLGDVCKVLWDLIQSCIPAEQVVCACLLQNGKHIVIYQYLLLPLIYTYCLFLFKLITHYSYYTWL